MSWIIKGPDHDPVYWNNGNGWVDRLNATVFNDAQRHGSFRLPMYGTWVEVAEEPSKTLDDLLDRWSVMCPGMWQNDQGPEGWWAVCNDEGIIAYFGDEIDACRWRLDMINRELNP